MSAQPSDTPILDLLGRMTVDSMETSNLDEQTLMLVRVAALVAVDAPPASYLLNLGAAGDVGVDSEQVLGVLAAVAPIVGTTRVVAAAGRMVKALGAAIELAELAEYAES
jgi:4-carboxymuconolactone decarboxylase